jgi:hypothetical protein
MKQMTASLHRYQSSYEGRRYNAILRREYIDAFGETSRETLAMFGYRTDDWGVREDAPDLNAYM